LSYPGGVSLLFVLWVGFYIFLFWWCFFGWGRFFICSLSVFGLYVEWFFSVSFHRFFVIVCVLFGLFFGFWCLFWWFLYKNWVGWFIVGLWFLGLFLFGCCTSIFGILVLRCVPFRGFRLCCRMRLRSLLLLWFCIL